MAVLIAVAAHESPVMNFKFRPIPNFPASLRACLAATLGLGLAAGAASASDLPSRGLPPPLAIPEASAAFTWTGIYLGAHAGYARGTDKATEFFTATGQFTGLSFPYRTKGTIAGIHAGANYQYGILVAGAVVDFDASSLKGGFNDPPVAPFNPGGISNLKVEGQGSLRGKLGVAIDRFQIYATGGAALGNLKYLYFNPSSGQGETTASWRSGWTAGGGVEYAFTDNILGYVEFRRTNLGTFKYASRVAYPGILTGQQQPRYNSGTVGLSYKF